MTTYIYALRCPESNEIRYIGKSTNPQRRLSAHISAAINKAYSHHASRWIRKLVLLDLSPSLEIMEEVPAGGSWRDVERRWIKKGNEKGWPLTNSTAGGEGLDYLNEDDKQAYLANLKSAMRRYRETDEGKAQFSKFRAASMSDETNEKRRNSVRAALDKPEYRNKMKAINSEINSRPEVKLKKSNKTKEDWKDPSVRAKRMESLASAEVKSRQSEKRKAAWADPVLGAKLRELHNSPEVRAKKSESAKNRATPEYRAMMAEKTRLAWVKRRNAVSKEP